MNCERSTMGSWASSSVGRAMGAVVVVEVRGEEVGDAVAGASP